MKSKVISTQNTLLGNYLPHFTISYFMVQMWGVSVSVTSFQRISTQVVTLCMYVLKALRKPVSLH